MSLVSGGLLSIDVRPSASPSVEWPSVEDAVPTKRFLRDEKNPLEAAGSDFAGCEAFESVRARVRVLLADRLACASESVSDAVLSPADSFDFVVLSFFFFFSACSAT